jgi:uncharacterized membrane protein
MLENYDWQSRLRSPVAWGSVFALFVVVFNIWELWDYIGMDVQEFEKLTSALASCFIIFGIWNNPTNKKGF